MIAYPQKYLSKKFKMFEGVLFDVLSFYFILLVLKLSEFVFSILWPFKTC